MTRLRHLKAGSFRNIPTLDITLTPAFNLIYGVNGSGKSTILEMIYCLGYGRSFRTHLTQPIIQYQADTCHVFGIVDRLESSITIGFQKSIKSKPQLKLGSENSPPTLIELAKLFPLQLIHPECHDLLNHGPHIRRRFFNWMMFHLEPQFLTVWKRYHQALKQRNMALQQHQPPQVIQAWDGEIAESGHTLTHLHQSYFEQFKAISLEFFHQWLGFHPIEIFYKPGWDTQQSLAVNLKQQLPCDRQRGYTTQGAHRFDLIFKIQHLPVEILLSRGEQKRFICALYLARGKLLHQQLNKQSIYLLDDIMNELDIRYQEKLWQCLTELSTQVFVTAIEVKNFERVKDLPDSQILQIENGKIC
jgi:DNA replication and repair protein RecF